MFWRLIGGKELDLALQKVIVIYPPSFYKDMLTFVILVNESFCLRYEFKLKSYLKSIRFSGSIKRKDYLWIGVSYLGVVLVRWTLLVSLMISLIFSSYVGGKSSSMFLLDGFEVFVTFRLLSIPKRSLFVSYLVQNLRFKKEIGWFAFMRFSDFFYSSMPKNEVFQGEQMNLSDSIFFEYSMGSVNCSWKYIFCSETLLFSFF